VDSVLTDRFGGVFNWMHAFMDVPHESFDRMCEFWSAATGWPTGAPWDDHPEFRSLSPPDGDPYLHLQLISGPPRVHLDLMSRDVDGDRVAHESLGAAAVERHRWWQVMASPGGLPYCLVAEEHQRRQPMATSWPDGHLSRVVQLCLDVPADTFDAEVAFWRSATGWPTESTRLPEFARLTTPESSPLRFLLQRLGAGDAGPVRGHLDLGTDDQTAEVDRLRRLAASVRTAGRWAVLVDPAGLPFCVSSELAD
jgi:Glyoxalase-like domain